MKETANRLTLITKFLRFLSFLIILGIDLNTFKNVSELSFISVGRSLSIKNPKVAINKSTLAAENIKI